MPFVKGYKMTAEHKARISAAMKGFHPVKEFKEGHHPANEFKSGQCSKFGITNSFYGKHHTEETRIINSTKNAEITKRNWQDPLVRRRRSEGLKRAWEKSRQNPEFMKKLFRRRIPSYYEERLIGLIERYTLPYQYTGDGQVWIGGKNPDFIHHEQKVVVEVYGTQQKRELSGVENYELDRALHFAKFGFSVIFLNEKDLFCEQWESHCLAKLN